MISLTGPTHVLSHLRSTVRHSPLFDRPGRGYRALIARLPQVVFEIDAGGAWSFLNISWQNVSGYGVAESLGNSYAGYLHPKDRDKCRQFFEQLRFDPDATRFIVARFLTRGGTAQWVEVHASPSPHPTGKVTGTLSVVTDRVQQEGLLFANHRSLTGLVNDLVGMVYRCRNNRDWTMEYVSRGSIELTGYEPDDIINSKALAYGKLIHPDDREQVWQQVQHALRDARDFELEYRIRTARNGEKWVWERGRGVFSASGEPLGVEGFITDITGKKGNDESRSFNSLYDSVTGLRTPPLFMDYLRHAAQSYADAKDTLQFALLIIHIDGLEDALAACEPGATKRAAREISARLKQTLAASDILSRVRNDRYLVLLTRVHHIRQVTAQSGRLQAQLGPPLDIGGNQLYVTASIGIAMNKSHYRGHRDILRDGEAALERAIALGGARQEVSDLHLQARAVAASNMEGELRQALEVGELDVYWQPSVSLQHGHFAGVEARLAWPHPRHGLLFAEQFVPMIEGSPSLEPLWQWMLTEVCRQMRGWQEINHLQPGAFVLISGHSLLDAERILRFRRELLRSKPESFELAVGVSEHALLSEPHAVADIGKRLRAKRIRLVLDNFGSAHSSLTLLKNLPIDLLRLDCRLFANDANDTRFAAAIVSFAHAMEARVIADGVDGEEMLATVRGIGCDCGQGKAVSRPLQDNFLWAFEESGERRQLPGMHLHRSDNTY
jgi:PAS domain S-box-containing protein